MRIARSIALLACIWILGHGQRAFSHGKPGMPLIPQAATIPVRQPLSTVNTAQRILGWRALNLPPSVKVLPPPAKTEIPFEIQVRGVPRLTLLEKALFPNNSKKLEDDLAGKNAVASKDVEKAPKASAETESSSTKLPQAISKSVESNTPVTSSTPVASPNVPPAPPSKPPPDPIQDEVKSQKQDSNGCWAYATASGLSALLKEEITGQQIRELSGNLDSGGEPGDTEKAAEKLGLVQKQVYSREEAERITKENLAKGIQTSQTLWEPGHVRPIQFKETAPDGKAREGDNDGVDMEKKEENPVAPDFYTLHWRKSSEKK